MFKRKLTALQFHSPDNFNINDPKEFRSLIVWLEDQKVRFYKIEDRATLKNIASKDWQNSYKQYLIDLKYPGDDSSDAFAVLDWLLGIAVRAEYGDNVKNYKEQTAENIAKTQSVTPQVISTNPLDNLNFDDPEFKNGINALAQVLNVGKHPDHLVTLKAISRLISQRMTADTIKASNSSSDQAKPEVIQEIDLGFDAGDYVLNQAAKILRWLYITDLRDLQTKANEAIVVVQSITANPQTDSRLGKVGK